MNIDLIALVIKPASSLFKKCFLWFKKRNKFFVEDYQKQTKEYYFCKKLGHNEYGVFNSIDNKLMRIYKKPEHENPKKLCRQYAKKLAMQRAIKAVRY